jgi:hypothetical protein
MVGLAIFIVLTTICIWGWLFYHLYKSQPQEDENIIEIDNEEFL